MYGRTAIIQHERRTTGCAAGDECRGFIRQQHVEFSGIPIGITDARPLISCKRWIVVVNQAGANVPGVPDAILVGDVGGPLYSAGNRKIVVEAKILRSITDPRAHIDLCRG